MMMSKIECLRCRTVMEQGFVMDRGQSSAPVAVATWVSGVPERSWWTGLKTKGRDQVELDSFLCRKCGYVEFRATTRLHD
jgi:hypothetical protein